MRQDIFHGCTATGAVSYTHLDVDKRQTYKLGKGKNSSKNPEYYYNEKVNLKSASKKGYVFKGWYTDSKYTKRIKTISKSSKKNLTLYAKWQKVTVKKSAIKKMKAVSGRKAKVTVQKVEGAAGYQIVYSTDKQFKNNMCIIFRFCSSYRPSS